MVNGKMSDFIIAIIIATIGVGFVLFTERRKQIEQF